SIADESTRAAAVKTGEVDIAYLFGGALAEELRRTQGVRIVAPLVYGVYWLDFLDQWDPKSPWHDRRVRLAASLAIDRAAINQAEMLGFAKLTGSFVPSSFEFALPIEPHPYDPKRAKLLHQIQKAVADHVLVAPLYQQAFIWGVGSRVAEPGAGLIPGYPYVAPSEDLKLK